MNLTNVVAQLEALSKNLESAHTVRERVKIADRIYEALQDIEQRVEKFVVTEIGHSNGAVVTRPVKAETTENKGRFAQLTLADAAKILLKEHGILHGQEIEKLLKQNGYESKSKKFQPTMVVAFNRDGGFVNTGGNRWKLKEAN